MMGVVVVDLNLLAITNREFKKTLININNINSPRGNE
jgi:hypothetical protein